MSLFDRFSQTVSAAYQALRGGSAVSIPQGAVVIDPLAAWRWTVAYTPERLDQIKAGRRLAEVVQLCDDMLTDDRIHSVAFMRAQALLGAEIEFVEGQGRKKKRALRAADAESDLWEMLPEAEWIQMQVWGVLCNFGTGRKLWWERAPIRTERYIPRRRNGRIVPAVEFWHPRNFRLDPASQQWIAKVNVPGQSILPVDHYMSFGDGEFVAFCPWGGAGDISRGLWLPAAKLWLLKQHVIRSGASLGQRMSTPIKVVEFALGQQGINTADAGGADLKRKQLVEEIFAMQRSGVVSLPPGFTMKLLGVPATSWQMLREQWTACDDAFAILWSGNNLTTSIKGGSLAASDNAQAMFTRVMKFDASGESTFLHDEVLEDWAEINFADRGAAPWPARNVDPPEDLKAKSATLLTVAQAVTALEKAGWMVDKQLTDEAYDMNLVPGQANTEKPPASALPVPAPNAPPPKTPPTSAAAEVPDDAAA